ncbi:MAG: hypothetical protein N838_17825 [Thiohalocapsa sp. PB-PSB1]|nr:MAG: hypothetical protein N838_17825 [Thiohalocapsa sp. PB-PSB1]
MKTIEIASCTSSARKRQQTSSTPYSPAAGSADRQKGILYHACTMWINAGARSRFQPFRIPSTSGGQRMPISRALPPLLIRTPP